MDELPDIPENELPEILQKFKNLKDGLSNSFLQSEDFEILVSHFEQEENYSAGLEAAEIGINQYPFYAGLFIDKANLLLLLHRYNDALIILSDVPEADNFATNIRLMRIEAYMALADEAEAIKELEFGLHMDYTDDVIEMLFEIADVFDSYEEFEVVYSCLHRVLELEPNNEEALYKICFWTDYTGRYEESITLHRKILDEFPFSELAWFNLGAAYQGLKLHEKAIDAYQYCIALDDQFEYAYRNLGDAYMRLRKYEDAIASLKKVSELSLPESVVLEAIGHCYERLRKYDIAREYYKKGSLLNAEDSHLIYKIGLTYMNEGEWQKAISNLQVACNTLKLQPDYNMALGQCYMELQNFTDALTHLGIVVRTRPKNKSGWVELLQCLYLAQMNEEGIKYAEFAYEQTDEKPVFLYYKSLFLFAEGKFKEGCIYLENGMQRNPRLIKRFIEINPSLLHHKNVLDILSRYRTRKHRG